MPVKKPIGKLRVVLTVEWEIENLEHYNAKNLEECAVLTNKQIADNEVDVEDIVTWGDVAVGKVTIVK